MASRIEGVPAVSSAGGAKLHGVSGRSPDGIGSMWLGHVIEGCARAAEGERSERTAARSAARFIPRTLQNTMPKSSLLFL